MTEAQVQIVNLDKINIRLNNIQNIFTTNKALTEVGEYVKFAIKKRTLEGKDADENVFAPYSARHRFFRIKHGFPVDKVDLTLTGGMLAAITYRVTRNEVKLFFMPGVSRKIGQPTQGKYGTEKEEVNATPSHPAKAYYLQQKRKFFALSENDEVKIREIYENIVKEAVESGI